MFVKIFQKACKFVLLDFDAILDLRSFNSTLGVVALSDRTVFRSFILTFLQLRRRDQACSVPVLVGLNVLGAGGGVVEA